MCKSCQVININGIPCHETGCPEAWKHYKRSCKWCGEMFIPERKKQDCCSHSCEVAYNGLDCYCDECMRGHE